MSPLDAFWHLLNFFAPAFGVGLLSTGLAKLLWRSALRSVRWTRLAGWACSAGALSLVGGLVLLGRDGRMATYGAMVLATATALLWAGWGPRRR